MMNPNKDAIKSLIGLLKAKEDEYKKYKYFLFSIDSAEESFNNVIETCSDVRRFSVKKYGEGHYAKAEEEFINEYVDPILTEISASKDAINDKIKEVLDEVVELENELERLRKKVIR